MKNRARKFAVKIMMVIFLSVMAPGLIQEFNSVEKPCGYMVEAKTKKKAVMSKKQAAKKLKKHLKKTGVYNKKLKLAYVRREGNRYVFHYYELVNNHTATYNWYYVNRKTGKIKAEF